MRSRADVKFRNFGEVSDLKVVLLIPGSGWLPSCGVVTWGTFGFTWRLQDSASPILYPIAVSINPTGQRFSREVCCFFGLKVRCLQLGVEVYDIL